MPGLVHGFWSKNGNFVLFYFSPKLAKRKCFLTLQIENKLFLAYINIDSKKSKTLHFFKGVSVSVFAKKLETLSFFVFSTIGQKRLSSDLVDRKLAISYLKTSI